MLDHLRGFGAHEKHVARERLEELFEPSALTFIPNTNDHALCFFERIDGPAQAQIFGRTGKMKLRELLLERATGADGKLRGNEHDAAGREMWKTAAQPFQHETHIRFVVIIHR